MVYSTFRTSEANELRIEVDNQGHEVPVETNGFHLFVYRRDADWSKQRIGIKYNEHWMELPEEAFIGPVRVGFAPIRAEFYFPFLKDYHAVAEDWKNSRRFAALPVSVPDNIAWGLLHEPIETPVTARAYDLTLVVLRYEELPLYFAQKRFSDFFCITVQECRHMEWTDKGLWEVQLEEGDNPQADGAASRSDDF